MLFLVFLLCVGVSGIYVLELTARRRQISQMLRLIRYLRREIRCCAAPLHHILSSENCPKGLPLLRVFSFEDPFDLTENYRKSKDLCEKEMFFSPEEWTAADDLFFDLGQGDGEEQERLLLQAETIFSQAEITVKESLSKNGKSALVLGCCAGAVLVLLLL